MGGIDRREFVRRSLRGALAATVIGGVPLLDLQALAQPVAVAPPLAVRQGAVIPQLVRQTVAALGGMGKFVAKGETVVVKPNIGWDRTVEQAANTHPLVVKAVVELCLEAGAKEVRLFDRTCNDPRRCYAQSGIEEAVKGVDDKRVVIGHMDRRAYQDLDIQRGVELQRWSFYRPALDADRFINLPIAKHHSISTVTLGMKNIMGVIGGNRGRLHRRIADSLSDINSIVRSDLTIVDATRVLIANGPQGGRLEDVRQLDTLVASPDIVAADAFAATLLGHQPEAIETLAVASRRGLGVSDLNKVRRL